MNRHARPAAEALARKRERNMACHTAFYRDYIQHLPQVGIDEPLDPSGVNYMVVFHDESCRFYSTNDISDCDCDPTIARFVEPAVRQ